jgi:thymidylate synthase
MQPTIIEATTISDAWFQCLYRLLSAYETETGARRYVVTSGSDTGVGRIEFDFIQVRIKLPGERPLLPQMPEHLNIPPVADDTYLDNYVQYLMESTKAPNERYTYGERLSAQLSEAIAYYREQGTLNNRMCMEIGRPEDLFVYRQGLRSTPCMRLIDTRILEDKLHFFVYFRSWNLWNGFPVNLAALQLVKEWMASEIGVRDGEILASSKGLNLRDYNLELAYKRIQKNPGYFQNNP